LKKIIWAIITLVIILILNWGTATLFNNDFKDWSFLTGLFVTIIVGYTVIAGILSLIYYKGFFK